MSLSRGARRLLETLKWWYRKYGAVFPGQRKLAHALRVKATRTIQRWLSELAKAGLVTWKRRGYRRTNIYSISVSCEPKCRINVASVVTRSSLTVLRKEIPSPLVIFGDFSRRWRSKKPKAKPMSLYDKLKAQGYPGFV